MATLSLRSVVLDCPDAQALGAFYSRLLGWPVVDTDHDWARIQEPGEGMCLSFQTEECYVAPVWPQRPGEPAMQMHLDVLVDDLEGACAWAVACGATLAEHQFADGVRVYVDPAGHPFCLFLPGS